MKIVETRYVLAVKDLAASAAYYQNKLGFTTVWAMDGWHSLQRDAFIVMLGECTDDRSAFETRNHAYFAYVVVEDVDALYAEYRSKDVDVFGYGNKPWGLREFGVTTIDGHRMMFGQMLRG